MDTKAIRKAKIAAMPRKELNAHAFLCEQEQEEYEREKRQLLDENERLRDVNKALESDNYNHVGNLDHLVADFETLKGNYRQLHGMYDVMKIDFDVAKKEAERLWKIEDTAEQLQADKAVAVEALRWYADLSNYMPPKPFYMPFIEVDKGQKANAALERIESGEKG